jgi:hypothetical protein
MAGHRFQQIPQSDVRLQLSSRAHALWTLSDEPQLRLASPLEKPRGPAVPHVDSVHAESWCELDAGENQPALFPRAPLVAGELTEERRKPGDFVLAMKAPRSELHHKPALVECDKVSRALAYNPMQLREVQSAKERASRVRGRKHAELQEPDRTRRMKEIMRGLTERHRHLHREKSHWREWKDDWPSAKPNWRERELRARSPKSRPTDEMRLWRPPTGGELPPPPRKFHTMIVAEPEDHLDFSDLVTSAVCEFSNRDPPPLIGESSFLVYERFSNALKRSGIVRKFRRKKTGKLAENPDVAVADAEGKPATDTKKEKTKQKSEATTGCDDAIPVDASGRAADDLEIS